MEDIVKLKEQLIRARKTALVLSTICVLSLMFAIFQYNEAKEANKSAEEQRALVLEERKKAMQAMEEADRQRILAQEQMAQALSAIQKVK